MSENSRLPAKKNNSENAKKTPPVVSHTKGFYRFSKTFPGTTDENGYRDNENMRRRPMSAKGRILTAVFVLFCFIFAFVATSVALHISHTAPKDATAPAQSETVDAAENLAE